MKGGQEMSSKNSDGEAEVVLSSVQELEEFVEELKTGMMIRLVVEGREGGG